MRARQSNKIVIGICGGVTEASDLAFINLLQKYDTKNILTILHIPPTVDVNRPKKSEAINDPNKNALLILSLRSDINNLSLRGACMLVMACSTVYHKDILSKLKFLGRFIDVRDALKSHQDSKVGIIAMPDSYSVFTEALGVNNAVLPEKALLDELSANYTKENREKAFDNLVQYFREQGVKKIILGRGDVLQLDSAKLAVASGDVINYQEILAKHVVQQAEKMQENPQRNLQNSRQTASGLPAKL